MTVPNTFAPADERWRQVAEQTDITPGQREILAGLLAGDGTTAAAASEGTARTEGTGREARWHLSGPGGDHRELDGKLAAARDILASTALLPGGGQKP